MSTTSRVFISPLAKRLIKEHGLQIHSIVGSGPNGRIVRRDVEALVGIEKPKSPFATNAPSEFELVPHTRIRKTVARRLTECKSTVPHFYMNTPVNVDRLFKLRINLNNQNTMKVSVTDLLLKIVAQSYIDVPDANVTWTDEAIKKYRNVDVALAVATDKGLMAPVLRSLDKMTLSELNASANDLIDRARSGKLKIEEIEGGTISLTNLGMYGIDQFSAILNPPQSLILAVGAAKPTPVVIDNKLEIATVMNVTLSVDHRAIDGALAAQWLNAFVNRCENPEWLNAI